MATTITILRDLGRIMTWTNFKDYFEAAFRRTLKL